MDQQNAPVGRHDAGASPPGPGWRRFLPIAILIALSGAAIASGAHRYLSFEYLLSSRQLLAAAILAHGAAALGVFMVTYVAAVALSLPGATLLTIAGGFLFGGALGGTAAALAATAGAILVFLAARCSLGAALRARAGPRLAGIRGGFERDAVAYMLFLRLTPAFPFFLVNLAPAILGVGLWTFAWTTLVGILPATFAFAYAGAGLDSVAAAQTQAFEACLASGAGDCRAHIYLGQLVTRELILSLAGIGAVALIPVVFRRWRARAERATTPE
jgi:uncharacterized membrane protein YdjX (TVP38/TMEM64 family)